MVSSREYKQWKNKRQLTKQDTQVTVIKAVDPEYLEIKKNKEAKHARQIIHQAVNQHDDVDGNLSCSLTPSHWRHLKMTTTAWSAATCHFVRGTSLAYMSLFLHS